MAEFASNAKGNTGVALGATALGLTGLQWLGNGLFNNCNNNGWGFYNNNCCNPYVNRETFSLGLQDASLKAELYTDQAVERSGKETIAEFRRSDAMISQVQKEANIELIKTRENVAVLQGQVACLQKELEAQNKLLEQKVDYENKLTNQKIDCLKNEFASAIALESERRLSADNSLMQFVQGNYIAGKLVMPKEKICPEVMPRYNCFETPKCNTSDVA